MAILQADVTLDLWLTGILDRKVYCVSVPERTDVSVGGSPEERLMLHDCLNEKPVFLYAKVASNEIGLLGQLEDLGFRLVDTTVVFEKPIAPVKRTKDSMNIRLVTEADREGVMDLARRSFVFSRFHMDRHIPRKTANEIKAQWAGNYFTGTRGDKMFVALEEGGIVGFLQLIFSDRVITIDLIAIGENHRGKGLARDMINTAEASLKEFNKMRVGTQVANISSLRLYEKLGFRVVNSGYVLHYHNL